MLTDQSTLDRRVIGHRTAARHPSQEYRQAPSIYQLMDHFGELSLAADAAAGRITRSTR